MRKTANISLTPQQFDYAQRLVREGKFQSISEFVRTTLRLYQERAEQQAALLERLESAAQEAANSGEAVPMESAAALKAAYRRRARSNA